MPSPPSRFSSLKAVVYSGVFVAGGGGTRTWVGDSRAEGARGPLSARGERLFADLACNTCHRSDGSGRGPALEAKFGTEERLATGAVVRVDESYVRESILNPQLKLVAGYQPLMPTFQGLVSEESVMALVEYVKSLQASPRAAGTAGESPAAGSPAQENR